MLIYNCLVILMYASGTANCAKKEQINNLDNK